MKAPDTRLSRKEMLCDIAEQDCRSLFDLAVKGDWTEFEEQLGQILRKQIGAEMAEMSDAQVADAYQSQLGKTPEGWENENG